MVQRGAVCGLRVLRVKKSTVRTLAVKAKLWGCGDQPENREVAPYKTGSCCRFVFVPRCALCRGRYTACRGCPTPRLLTAALHSGSQVQRAHHPANFYQRQCFRTSEKMARWRIFSCLIKCMGVTLVGGDPYLGISQKPFLIEPRPFLELGPLSTLTCSCFCFQSDMF